MADEIQVLNGNQFHEVFQDPHTKYEDALYRSQMHRRNPRKKDPMQGVNFPGFHYTKWENIEKFYHEGDWNAQARYLCYMRDGDLLGVNKFYVEPVEKHYDNPWRVKNGLAPMKGHWWGHAFVDVREDIQRQGIAVKLFDKMLSMMKPGDVFSSDMYSPQGQPTGPVIHHCVGQFPSQSD